MKKKPSYIRINLKRTRLVREKMNKRPDLYTTLAGIACLTIIFIVNAYTIKADNYLTMAIIGTILWLLRSPADIFRRK